MENNLTAINIFCRTAKGMRFASLSADLWYVYYVRVSFRDYQLRFVGSQDNVIDAVACFYNFK